MVLIRDFLMKLTMLFDIIAKSNTSKRKVGFDFNFKSQVKGIPIWLKASNSSPIEKSMGYHSETEVKDVGRTFQKVKGWNEHVHIIFGASYRQLNKVKYPLVFKNLFILLFYLVQPIDICFIIDWRRRTKETVGYFHKT